MAHYSFLHAWVLTLQVLWTLWNSCNPPDSSAHGIFQARILEWVAISYCRVSSWPRDWTHISCISCIGRQIFYHCATWEALIPSCLWLFQWSYLNGKVIDTKWKHRKWLLNRQLTISSILVEELAVSDKLKLLLP